MLQGRKVKVGTNKHIENVRKEEKEGEAPDEDQEAALKREEGEAQAGDQQGQELVEENRLHKDKTLLQGSIEKVGINENIKNVRKEEKEEAAPEEVQEEGRLKGGKGGSKQTIKIETEPRPVSMDPINKPEKQMTLLQQMEMKRIKKQEAEKSMKGEEAARNSRSRKKTGTPSRKAERKVEEALQEQKQRENMRKMLNSWKTGRVEDGRKKLDKTHDKKHVVDVNVEDVDNMTGPVTRPEFKAALRMFSKPKEVTNTSYEAWKVEKQARVERKRKKDQSKMEEEQNNTTAGREKFLRLNLSSSKTGKNSKFKSNNLTCSSISKIRGDTGGVGDAVQEGGGVQNFTVQRAGLGEQINSNECAAAMSGRTGSGTVRFLYSKQV